MPRIRGCTWRATCWEPKLRTCCDRSSSPTSTTSAASIAGSPTREGPARGAWRFGVSGVHLFWLRDGAVAAAMNVNQWDDGDALQELVDSGRHVTDKELLAT